ncbi:hypothetical protein GALL_502770 [mine drainage metagenome]|uniref:Uncharacterized protein n=1 Tax=mine drainage metagenome TaxID=410659 RepID=A0A1J5PK06_9ZZZZ
MSLRAARGQGERSQIGLLRRECVRVAKNRTGQLRQRLSGRQLDEMPYPVLEQHAAGVVPMHGGHDVVGQIRRHGACRAQQTGRGVAGIRQLGLGEALAGQRLAQCRGDAGQQRAVRRHGDIQALGAARALRPRGLQHALQRLVGARDGELRRRIQIGQISAPPRLGPGAGGLDHGFHRAPRQAADHGHAVALRVGLLHQRGAQAHQAQALLEGQHAGDDRRRVGAHGKAGHGVGTHPLVAQGAGHAHAGDHDGQLHRHRRAQRLGAIELADLAPENPARLVQGSRHRGVPGQAVQETGGLRALPGA